MVENKIAVKEILKPYRKLIDDLDKELVSLLVKRFKIIEEVAEIKHKYNIPSVLQDRVDEVRNNAADMAAKEGLSHEFVYELYSKMIDYACKLEDEIMNSK